MEMRDFLRWYAQVQLDRQTYQVQQAAMGLRRCADALRKRLEAKKGKALISAN